MPQFSGHWYSGRAARLVFVEAALVGVALSISGHEARGWRELAALVGAAGCVPEDTVKLTYYVTDLKLYQKNLSAIATPYREVFGRHYPASTLIEVKSLFDPDALIEIDAVAVRRT